MYFIARSSSHSRMKTSDRLCRKQYLVSYVLLGVVAKIRAKGCCMFAVARAGGHWLS